MTKLTYQRLERQTTRERTGTHPLGGPQYKVKTTGKEWVDIEHDDPSDKLVERVKAMAAKGRARNVEIVEDN